MMDWGDIYRHLSAEYGFTPQEIGNLTFPQLRAYLTPQGEPKDTGRLAEARALMFAEAERKKRADEKAALKARREKLRSRKRK